MTINVDVPSNGHLDANFGLFEYVIVDFTYAHSVEYNPTYK